MATIQGIYIALFGRPADPLGLAFFNEATNNGADLTAIGDLSATAEYQSRFEGMNSAQIVTAIYQSLFGRNPELAGLEFFVAELESGRQNINTIAINILDGAQGADAEVVANKEAAANLWTDAVAADPDALAAYQGQAGIDAGVAFLAGITADDATVPTEAQVEAAINMLVDGTGTPGDIFTLTGPLNPVTGGADVIVGTAGDDTFRAVIANSLGSEDQLNGGGGFDTLNISAGAIAAGAAPVISNIERINNADATALNLTSVTGAQQIWTTGAAGTYTNANLGTIFGAQNSAATAVNLTYAGSLAGSTAVNLAVNMTGGNTATFNITNGNQIEVVNLSAVGGSSVANILGLTAAETINVDGAGRVTVQNTAQTVTTFDASENSGGVTWTSGNLLAAATVTGGSGNDVINMSAVVGNFAMTIDAGAGNDIITGGAGRDIINAGAGNDVVNSSTGADTITLGAGNDVVVYTAVSHSAGVTSATVDTITDFNASGNDTIDVSAAGVGATALNSAANLIAIQNAVDALAPTATLADALATIVAGNSANDTVSYFEFNGNTYVVADVNGAAGFNAGADLVVELTGSVALTAADFTFA